MQINYRLIEFQVRIKVLQDDLKELEKIIKRPGTFPDRRQAAEQAYTQKLDAYQKLVVLYQRDLTAELNRFGSIV